MVAQTQSGRVGEWENEWGGGGKEGMSCGEGQMRVSTRVPCPAGVAGRLKSIQTVGVGWLDLARFPTGQLSISIEIEKINRNIK